jgi:hypothetical protein
LCLLLWQFRGPNGALKASFDLKKLGFVVQYGAAVSANGR